MTDAIPFDDPGLADLPARFTLKERLGQGGMATVYLADDETARTSVALKVLHPHLRSDKLVVERFRREIAAARRIQHRNIIRIHDLIETPRLDCLVLEYHPGSDLKRVIRRRGAFPLDEALPLAQQLLAGLGVAHRAGVVHRDIKPHNILLDDEGVAKITDFGLARVDDLIGVTTHTMTLGTPEYMAPELLGSPIVDSRTDLYSVGIVLFELLSGKLPFRASSPMALLHLHQNEQPPYLCDLNPTIPAWLADTVRRAMAKAPEDRFATADEMREALQPNARALVKVDTALAESRTCPKCAAPLLPGIASCVECGAERVHIGALERGGGRLIVDRRFSFSASETDHLTFADKARIYHTLTRLGGQMTLDENKLDKRLRSPPVVLASRLSDDDGEALQTEIRAQGIDTVKYVPEKKQFGLVLKMGEVGSNTLTSALLAIGAMVVAGVPSWASFLLFTLVFTTVMTGTRAFNRMSALTRFDTGADGVRQSPDALIGRATRVFASIHSERLRRMTRRILSRGLHLRQLLEDSDKYSADMLQNLDQVLIVSLNTAENLAQLEAAVSASDVADIHEQMERLEQQVEDADDIYELENIAEQQQALREQLSDLDEKQATIVRLSGQLLGTSSRLSKMHRECDAGDEQDIESMSVILQDMEFEMAAHKELDEEL